MKKSEKRGKNKGKTRAKMVQKKKNVHSDSHYPIFDTSGSSYENSWD